LNRQGYSPADFKSAVFTNFTTPAQPTIVPPSWSLSRV